MPIKYVKKVNKLPTGPKPSGRVAVTLRLDPDLVEALKGNDKTGWLQRANDAIRKGLGK